MNSALESLGQHFEKIRKSYQVTPGKVPRYSYPASLKKAVVKIFATTPGMTKKDIVKATRLSPSCVEKWLHNTTQIEQPMDRQETGRTAGSEFVKVSIPDTAALASADQTVEIQCIRVRVSAAEASSLLNQLLG